MPSAKPSSRVRQPAPRPDLKQRVAALKAKARAVTRGRETPSTTRPPDPPADLAGACAWAIEHRAWIDRADLDDAALKAEIERGEAVMLRAAVEPSRGLPDLAAKARMLLDDLIAMDVLDDTWADQRLIPVVLREVVAMGEAQAERGEEAADHRA